MNLAYKKILGKFTKVLGFGKTPPSPCWEKFPNDIVFFLRAYLSCIIIGIGSSIQIQGRWQLHLELVHILNHQTNQSCYIEALPCGNCIIIGPSWLHNCSWSIFGWVLYTLEFYPLVTSQFYPLVTSQMHHHSKSKRGNNCILDIKGWGTFSGRLKMLMVAVCHCIWLI